MATPNIIQGAVAAPRDSSAPRPADLAPLLVVYLVWGSTFLGIALAVRGDGFAPFQMGALRFGVAGALMLGFAWATRRPVAIPARTVARLAVCAATMWVGGNGLVTWAVTRVDSGYAALAFATAPLWIVGCESILDRRRPPLAVLAALAFGFAGIAVLSVARVGGGGADVLGVAMLAVAALCWAAGFVTQRRLGVSDVDVVASAGYQLLLASAGFAAVSVARGEAIPSPDAVAWSAFAYLVIVGSILGFGCWLLAVRRLEPSLVTTHSYVNPVVAVVLGWLVLGEAIDLATWCGAAMVLVSVAVVFRHR